LGIGGRTGCRQGALAVFNADNLEAEALLVKRGEESVNQADEFIFEFRRTKER
jgi:hypothetical protein